MLLHGGAYPPHFSLASGESCPSSPDNFRQLDDVFLQTQTRIWLGEVLRTRLNEHRSIADLLADGELLFEVSKEVWKMMLSKRSELKAYDYEPFASRNGGRYMPYSFVDSFLKMCKILGLDGIDLFSPSDVVEKGDTRKVCVCLRALSNKARSLHLNVPDFDIVTSTVSMPTDMVGYIRRSWELSLSEYSSSSNLAQHQKLRQRSSQERSNESCGRNYLSVKEFGDSETKSTLQSDSTTSNYLYNLSSDLSSSSIKAGVETQEEEESSHCEQAEVSSRKFEGSFLLHQLDYNQEESAASSSVVDSKSQSGGSFVNLESGSGNICRSNFVEQIYHNFNLEDQASVVGDSLQCSREALSTITGNGTYTGESGVLDDNSRIFNACVGSSSCCSKNMGSENEYTSPFLDGDDVEISSVGSVNSTLIYVRNLDFDDAMETEEYGHETTEESPRAKTVDTGLSLPKCCIACPGKYTTGHIDPVMPYDKNVSKSHTYLKARDEGNELFAADSCFAHGFSQWDQKGKYQIALVPTGNVGCHALSQSPSPLDSYEQNLQCIQGEDIGDGLQHEKECSTVIVKSDPDACKQANGCSENAIDSSHEDVNISCSIVENGNMKKNEETIQKLAISAVEQTDTAEIAKSKPQKRPLLKAVVSGTAVVGATLVLLHFRKNGREKSAELGKQSDRVRSSSKGRNISSGKAQKAGGAYPAEKLKF